MPDPEPYIGEIRLFSFRDAPEHWVRCAGQELRIQGNEALFQLLGTTYGGDGTTTFRLPDLRGRTPIHAGQGLPPGTRIGELEHTLSDDEMPAHSHRVRARQTDSPSQTPAPGKLLSDAGSSDLWRSPPENLRPMHPQMIGREGAGRAHPNLMPYTVVGLFIALQGIFPTPS